LYNALILREQIWQVWWLHGAIEVCSIVLAQIKHTSPSELFSTELLGVLEDVSFDSLS
jgi:hypothetical protein